MVAGLTPEMLKKLSDWSKVPSQANQSKHHPVFNMMKRDGGFFDPRDMIELNCNLLVTYMLCGRRTIGDSLFDPTSLSLNDRYHGKVHLLKAKTFTNDSNLSTYNCLLKSSDHLYIENTELQ